MLQEKEKEIEVEEEIPQSFIASYSQKIDDTKLPLEKAQFYEPPPQDQD